MGNLCFCTKFQNNYQDMNDKKRCIKCQDLFKVSHGGFSERMSCRYHTYRDGHCIDCNKKKGKYNRNCYHQIYR